LCCGDGRGPTGISTLSLHDALPIWDVATMYRAASDSEEVEVGGDFYDFFDTDDGWIVLLGDVTGRGVEAASMTSLVRHGARFVRSEEHTSESSHLVISYAVFCLKKK